MVSGISYKYYWATIKFWYMNNVPSSQIFYHCSSVYLGKGGQNLNKIKNSTCELTLAPEGPGLLSDFQLTHRLLNLRWWCYRGYRMLKICKMVQGSSSLWNIQRPLILHCMIRWMQVTVGRVWASCTCIIYFFGLELHTKTTSLPVLEDLEQMIHLPLSVLPVNFIDLQLIAL